MTRRHAYNNYERHNKKKESGHMLWLQIAQEAGGWARIGLLTLDQTHQLAKLARLEQNLRFNWILA